MEGYATYYFKIILPQKYVGKSFIIRPKHFIAYTSQLSVNEKVVSYNGVVSNSADDPNYKPERVSHCSSFKIDSTVLNVIIKVSNFTHFRGGIFNSLHIGLSDDMIYKREHRVVINLAVIVSLFIMFIYHFIMFFVNSNDKASLFFSLTCLTFAIDFSFNDAMTFFILIPSLPFEIANALQLSTPFILPSIFLSFLYAMFPAEVSKTLRNIAVVITAILVSLAVFTDNSIYNHLIIPHVFYMLFIVLYMYIPVIKAVKNKRDGALFFLIAYILFSLSALNDILHLAEVIYTTNMVSSGLMIFIVLLSIIQGMRFRKMFTNNLELAKNLKELNIGLEKKVEERTQTISKQAQKLDQSLKELKKLSFFKEDMTNMIVHDLKSPLNSIINIKLFKDENLRFDIVQQSGRRMLNMVQNILDVYKYEQSNIMLNKKHLELLDLLSASVNEVKFTANQKKLTINTAHFTNCLIEADEDFIIRVFTNLLNNAIKYTPKGSTINIFNSFEEDNYTKISVYNPGEGIPKNMHTPIFDKFTQIIENKQVNYHSSGLGLTFCKMAVNAHQGQIGVISETETGVEFWFTLPCLKRNNPIKNKTEKEAGKLNLSMKEKESIKDILEKIKSLEPYEISGILNQLYEIDTESSSSLYQWQQGFKKALYNQHLEEIQNLIEIAQLR